MAKSNILIRPVISEKSELNSEKLGQYTFVVDKKANKIQIAKVIEEKFNVNVVSVNTLVMPAKARSRYTRAGVLKGRISGYKKAMITVEEGEVIDFYGNV